MSIQTLLNSDANKKDINIFVNDLAVAGTVIVTGDVTMTKLTVDNVRIDGQKVDTISGNLLLDAVSGGQVRLQTSAADRLIVKDGELETSVKIVSSAASNLVLDCPVGQFIAFHDGDVEQCRISDDGVNITVTGAGSNFKMNGNNVLDATNLGVSVVNSSLKNVGILDNLAVLGTSSSSRISVLPSETFPQDTNGAADLISGVTTVRASTSAGGFNVTLADGSDGQIKHFLFTSKTGTDKYGIQPASVVASFTTATLDNVGSSLTLIWTIDSSPSGWVVIASNDVTFS